MKISNFIFWIFILFFINILSAQTNNLTIEEYNNIKINDVVLSDIIDTRGNESLIKSLFNEEFIIEKGYSDASEYWISFSLESIYFIFEEGLINDGVITYYGLTNLEIKNSSTCLKIKDIEVKIGDPISILGDVKFLTYSDGVTRITYKLGAQVIRIEFDPNTRIITGIKYQYYNT